MKFNEYINLSNENAEFSKKLTNGDTASFNTGIDLFRTALLIAIIKNPDKTFKKSLKKGKGSKNFQPIGAIDPNNWLRDILVDRAKIEISPSRLQDMGNWGLELLRENYMLESGDYIDWEKIKKELL